MFNKKNLNICIFVVILFVVSTLLLNFSDSKIIDKKINLNQIQKRTTNITNNELKSGEIPRNIYYEYIRYAISFLPKEVIGVQHFATSAIACAHEIYCIYNDKCVGFILDTNELRRPIEEHTRENINKATTLSLYRFSVSVVPEAKAEFAKFLIDNGYDPEDGNQNLDNPAGVGNYVFEKTFNYFTTDGSNKLGDANGREFNRRNYSDSTGYQPKNSYFDDINDIDPDKWTPLIYQLDNTYGVQVIQTYKSPQFGNMKTYSGITKKEMEAATPDQNDLYKDSRGKYRKKVNKVLQESRKLTDKKKMIAELFDMKAVGFTGVLGRLLGADALDFDKFFLVQQAANLGFLDGFIAMWYLKTKYDAVRPETAVKYVYRRGNGKIRAWGGPGKGVVTMKPQEWKSYLPTDAFPEYPSGTSCLCYVLGSVIRKYRADQDLNISFTFEKGSSFVEPGFTPKEDVTVTWQSADEFEHDCTQSRLWGGVHFEQAVESTKKLCNRIGEENYDRAVKLFKGENVYGK
jgi:hypothetical protein